MQAMAGEKSPSPKRPPRAVQRFSRRLSHYGLQDDKSKVFCVNVEGFRIDTLEGQVP